MKTKKTKTCKGCGKQEHAEILDFVDRHGKRVGLCEPCSDRLRPDIEATCEVCGMREATYIPPTHIQAPATCQDCADHGAKLAYYLNG